MSLLENIYLNLYNVKHLAGMAELADALASGVSESNLVEVRVLFSAYSII